METIMKVRRWVLVEGQSQREVSRRTGLSRQTIRKYLQDDRPPAYRRIKEVGGRRLFEYEVMLRGFYETDLARPVRERRTIRGLYDALVCAGYAGSYATVCRYIKRLKPGPGKAGSGYIPLEFDPGDAAQFDWSQEIVSLGGVDTKIYVAHFRLCHSRKPFLIAYLRESQEMVLDAFARALSFYGGVPRRVIIDNASTMVTGIGKGREREYHPRFLACMNHYVIEPEACNPASGWEKGQVENQVGVMRRQIFAPKLSFAALADLNTHLQARCEVLAGRPHPEQKDRSIAAVFTDEKDHLRPLGRGFDGYTERQVRVSSTCLARFDTNSYSVPSPHAGGRLSLRAYADRIVLTDGAAVIASHERSFERHRMIFDPWHYLPLLRRKPGALRDGAPFKDWNLPEPLRMIRTHYQKQRGGERDFVELLNLCQTHGHDAVEMACELAAAYGTMQLPVIISLIHDLTDDVRPAEMTAEASSYPKLRLPPKANCARYEQLVTSREAVA